MFLIKWLFIMMPFIISSCSSCNGQNKSKTKIVDTISKDIPLDKQGLPIRPYLFKNNIVKKVNIELLENGFDSLQIRVWYSPAFADSVYLLALRNINGAWSANISDYEIKFNKNRNTIDSIIGKSVKVYPKSGWQFFLDRIFNLEITTLPDIDAIIEPLAMFDDGGIAIEVSTKIKYRFYHYLESTLCDENILQARKMESIMQLIKQEFDFTYSSCQ